MADRLPGQIYPFGRTNRLAHMRGLHQSRLADSRIEVELASAMASTDALTGLLNRGGLVDAIESPRPLPGTLLFIRRGPSGKAVVSEAAARRHDHTALQRQSNGIVTDCVSGDGSEIDRSSVSYVQDRLFQRQ